MKIFTIYLTFFLVYALHSQGNVELNKFFSDAFKYQKRQVLYTNKIPSYEIDRIKESLRARDTVIRQTHIDYILLDLPKRLIFSRRELLHVQGKIFKANTTGWVKEKIPDAKFVDITKIGDYYSVYYVSKPIFLRENSLCVFYWGSWGFGRLSVYIKVNGDWIYYGRLFEWVS